MQITVFLVECLEELSLGASSLCTFFEYKVFIREGVSLEFRLGFCCLVSKPDERDRCMLGRLEIQSFYFVVVHSHILVWY